MKNWIRFPLVLGLICVFAACGVASIYVVTRKPIEKQQQKKQEEALEILFGRGARQRALNASASPLDRVYEVTDAGGRRLGFLAVGVGKGYSSKIRVMVGVECEAKPVRSPTDLKRIRGIKILFQNETPGLGSRVEEVESDRTWFTVLSGHDTGDESGRRAKFQEAFSGLPLVPEASPKGHADTVTGATIRLDAIQEVDGITGATISSNAVKDAVEDAVRKIIAQLAPGSGNAAPR